MIKKKWLQYVLIKDTESSWSSKELHLTSFSWFQIPIKDAKDNSQFFSCVLGCQAFEQK